MNKSTLIERLRIGVAGFPMIAEHPSLLMTEAADRLEELDAQLIAAEELNDDQAHRLGKAAATIERVRESLRGLWAGVHLDGHNEHGSHVLPLACGNMELTEEDLQDDAEDIYKDAAFNGFCEAHAVILKYKTGDDGLEFCGVDHVLTELFYGSAAQQEQEHKALEKQE